MQSDEIHDNPPKALRSLADDLKASIHARPDPNTLAWWERRYQEVLQAYKGASHSINMAVANTRDNEARLKTFSEMLEDFKNELSDIRADLGALQAENVTIREEHSAYRARIEKWAADMEKWAVTKGKQPQQKENPNAGQN
jgi:regulator of replication initiation timing